MTRQANWDVTIAHLDGSILRFSEERDRAPKVGEEFKMSDTDGKILNLRVESVARDPYTAVGPETYKVRAKEI
jgi:hypothetical protein